MVPIVNAAVAAPSPAPAPASAASPGGEAGEEPTALSALLLEAAKSGNVKELARAIANGATVTARDKKGNTALHCAAIKGNVACVEMLLTAPGIVLFPL
jgi:ankyrin repeat protein